MNLWDKIMTIVMVVCVSYTMSEWRIYYAMKDLHCQPITTHNTLEEAKAKVIEYQERVK